MRQPPINTPINTMLIKIPTLSANNHQKMVEMLSVLFEAGDPSNTIKGVASACTFQAANLNDDAIKKGMIEDEYLGAVTAISPMEIGTTIDVLMSLAYQAGLKAGKESIES